jgi:hypothetical protein
MKLAFAYLIAAIISSGVASLLPSNRLSLMVPSTKTGSYETYPMDSLNVLSLMSLILIESK